MQKEHLERSLIRNQIKRNSSLDPNMKEECIKFNDVIILYVSSNYESFVTAVIFSLEHDS